LREGKKYMSPLLEKKKKSSTATYSKGGGGMPGEKKEEDYQRKGGQRHQRTLRKVLGGLTETTRSTVSEDGGSLPKRKKGRGRGGGDVTGVKEIYGHVRTRGGS